MQNFETKYHFAPTKKEAKQDVSDSFIDDIITHHVMWDMSHSTNIERVCCLMMVAILRGKWTTICLSIWLSVSKCILISYILISAHS